MSTGPSKYWTPARNGATTSHRLARARGDRQPEAPYPCQRRVVAICVLTSRMHMAWMRAITGRLKSRYMYPVGVVYDNFPWPALKDKDRSSLDRLPNAVLTARRAPPECTLADLYGSNMPEDLERAHRALDAAVDRIYRSAPFSSDRDRVEHFVRPLRTHGVWLPRHSLKTQARTPRRRQYDAMPSKAVEKKPHVGVTLTASAPATASGVQDWRRP